ncbi:phosphogluconate dehydrogenase (NAD(+)-dependent, decarboxylating) [Amphibacillus cookii]|uniref:phosphogluconate dehydrogenase (NAD(+)-dependent, decarboxylating) n=1 Tax=Amphibacillus cookii TaxID=767787 RepID=UPI00195BDB33|nr:6-phosphogluconate dehydrogenase [Amphibacillus cookii]
MKVAIIGLGKMGMNLTRNLLGRGYQVIAYDINANAVSEAGKEGAIEAYTLDDVVIKLGQKKIIWMMVPAGDATEHLIKSLTPKLVCGDILIDGGNSNYKDTIRRAHALRAKEIGYLDVGTSGGTEGARYGVCIMIGGDKQAYQEVEPIFKDVSVPNGYLYTGPSGSGHFLKMVHNGIEYGMMQAIGEGFDILEKSVFDYDFEQVARVWNNGSVIRSWLIELLQDAFAKDQYLKQIKGVVHSSGEGKWTVETALELQAVAPVIALSLMMRNRTLEQDTFSGKVVASLRNQFGGHSVESY